MAATAAKIATQMTVTNQKTKSIRSASSDAGRGSQPGTSASVNPAAAATTANRISWRIGPLRTVGPSLLHGRFGPSREAANETPATKPLRPQPDGGFARCSYDPRGNDSHGLKQEAGMGLGVGIFLIAVGAVLTFAVNATASGVDLDTVGWILMGVGLASVLLSLLFWSSWAGPGYWGGGRRRETYVDEGPPPAY